MESPVTRDGEAFAELRWGERELRDDGTVVGIHGATIRESVPSRALEQEAVVHLETLGEGRGVVGNRAEDARHAADHRVDIVRGAAGSRHRCEGDAEEDGDGTAHA